MNNKYQRLFLILSQEDRGYGNPKEPSGYIKIEIKDRKGKVNISVQNLPDREEYRYRLYFLRNNDTEFVPVSLGLLPMRNQRCELTLEVDSENLEGSGWGIGDFNIAAVIAEPRNGENREVICPLAAYKEQKSAWRDRMKKHLLGLLQQYEPENPEAVSINTSQKVLRKKVDAESLEKEPDRKVPEDTGKIVSVASLTSDSPKHQADVGAEGAGFDMPPTEDISAEDAVRMPDSPVDMGGVILDENLRELEQQKKILDTIIDPAQGNQEYEVSEIQSPEQEQAETELRGAASPANMADGRNLEEQSLKNDTQLKVDMNSYFDGKEEKPVMEPDLVNQELVNPCEYCMNDIQRSEGQEGSKKPTEANLRGSLDKHFEQTNPFRNSRKDYCWWRVKNLVYLNNILHKFNLRMPLLFHPGVLMAHFKYKHILSGIYMDPVKKRELMVFGIPSVFQVDEQPLGGLGRWGQLDGGIPKFGDFGYWLFYLDIKTGRMLNH